ncbi:MAG: hypothetical protein CMJ42_13445 [Phyllobacteriaceae bacterium]|nr:hypothetical protein [Phyllobacteriaceae bacterium]MBA89603.1 hypothetical protein [Phyllobacteriaceae bacterium]
MSDQDTFDALIGQLSHIGGRHGQRFEREFARHLVKQIAGHAWGGKTEALARAHAAIMARHPQSGITLRRVRGIWHREAAVISFAEMCDLASVALEQTEGDR